MCLLITIGLEHYTFKFLFKHAKIGYVNNTLVCKHAWIMSEITPGINYSSTELSISKCCHIFNTRRKSSSISTSLSFYLSFKIWPLPPGGLPSMGSHRVGQDWSDLAAVAAAASSPFRALTTRGQKWPNHLVCFCWLRFWIPDVGCS